ncbi:MAG: acyl-CoA dehydratase activase [bacterium]|nr:acyl-CoA dehydratase activase [bacterium]
MSEQKFFSIGLDIGSTYAKAAVLDSQGNLCKTLARRTGWNSANTARELYESLQSEGFVASDCACDKPAPSVEPSPHDNAAVCAADNDSVSSPCRSLIAATGYGRVSVPFADKSVTEISCHGRGASWIFGKKDMCIIDIGGQDTKIIRVENGYAADFFMNDKCSAGTGRFLEVMGRSMELEPGEVCEMARSGGGVKISSLCTVFAESEIISLIGRGESRANICHAVVDSIADKVASQSRKIIKGNDFICLTGGLCECQYLVEVLFGKLRASVATNELARFAGAIGAALFAKDLAQ